MLEHLLLSVKKVTYSNKKKPQSSGVFAAFIQQKRKLLRYSIAERRGDVKRYFFAGLPEVFDLMSDHLMETAGSDRMEECRGTRREWKNRGGSAGGEPVIDPAQCPEGKVAVVD
jgi:hypothetical protein